MEAASTFVDDMLVASATFEQHVADVLNEEKCVFGEAEMGFPGHHVIAACISPMQDKIDRVLQHPKPVTMQQLQAFLGMFNLYCCFVSAAAN